MNYLFEGVDNQVIFIKNRLLKTQTLIVYFVYKFTITKKNIMCSVSRQRKKCFKKIVLYFFHFFSLKCTLYFSF